MLFELLHAPFPAGYTEALLPLALCKQHLHADSDVTAEDDLIEVLRDAAIDFVEQYCGCYLGPRTGAVWKGEGFPAADATPLVLGVRQVSAITAVAWQDSTGAAVAGDAGDFRVTLHGDVLPAVGQSWPTDVGGAVQVTFTAGFAADAAPPALLGAARLMLGDFYMNREAMIEGQVQAIVPFGVARLCSPYRRIAI